ncbi:MAG: outer membrane beta-barrel protein [Pseudomonadota bacterium]
MRHALLAAALITAPAAVMAEGISYTYVDARYFSTDSDALSTNQQGGTLSGSLALGDIFFVAADGSYGESEDITLAGVSGSFQTTAAALRLGVHHTLAPTLDIVASAGGLYGEVRGKDGFSGAKDDDTGYLVEAGLRLSLVPQVEVAALYNYADIFEETSSGFVGELQFHFTEHISAVASANFARSTDIYSFGARYRF